MGRKSESSTLLETRVSATEASRSFSRLLDEIEAGHRFIVRRRGRDLCLMVPAEAPGRRASECLALLRSREPVLLDDRFGDDLLHLLSEELPEDRPSWDS